jgi:hypothetical protein
MTDKDIQEAIDILNKKIDWEAAELRAAWLWKNEIASSIIPAEINAFYIAIKALNKMKVELIAETRADFIEQQIASGRPDYRKV